MKKRYSLLLASLLLSSSLLGVVPVFAQEIEAGKTTNLESLKLNDDSRTEEINTEIPVAEEEAGITEEEVSQEVVNEEIQEENSDEESLAIEDMTWSAYPKSGERSDLVAEDSVGSLLNSMLRATEPDNVNATDTNRPQSDFIDVSSHNGNITVQEYRTMREQYGVKGVAVKLSEGTTYKNPNARLQINNAISAGLVVSVYHYTHYDNNADATAEANFFATVAGELGISNKTVMIADIEEKNQNVAAINDATDAFKNTLNSRGFANVAYYLSRNRTDLGGGQFNTVRFGRQNCWIAQYPYTPTNSQNFNSNTAAWQWSSRFYFPHTGARRFDINQDYSGLFTKSEFNESTPVTGSINITEVNETNQSHIVSSTISANGYTPKEVFVVYWPDGAADSEKKWVNAVYEGSDKWAASLNVADFGKVGTYQVHVYVRMNHGGALRGIATSSFKEVQPQISDKNASATVTTYNAATGQYDVIFNPGEIANLREVKVRTWTKSDQSDTGTVVATKQSDGTYKATISVKNYNYTIGDYQNQVDVYVTGARIPGYIKAPTVKVTDVPLEVVQLYRAYNPNSGEHLYTSSLGEKQYLVSLGWKDENEAWKSPSKGTAVWRLYNPNTGEHFYTLREAEYEAVASKGWRKEGRGFYSADSSQGVPVYRVFNPNASGAGSHHFTTNKAERDNLISKGWQDENIAFYAMK